MKKEFSWINPKSNELFKTLVKLKTVKTVQNFIRDLLTVREIKELSNRWRGAKMLEEGRTFFEIEKETGLSPNTIARINKFRKDGYGGYESMLKRNK